MKKRFLFIITLLMIIFIGRDVYAYELNCPSGPFSYGDIFECYVFGNLENYDALSGTLDKDNYLDCHFDVTKSELDIIEDNSKSFSLKGKAFNNTLVTFSCTVTSKQDSNVVTSLSIEDFKYLTANGEGDEIILHSKDININKYVDNSQNKPRDINYNGSLINKLSIEGVTFPSTGFSKYVTEYEIKVPYEISTANFNITLADPNASYEIKGDTKNLRVSETTTIDVWVTSADNTHQTCYTFNITRYAEGETFFYVEDDATLQTLAVDGYTIDFDPNIEKYDINVKSDVTALKVTAKPNVDGAKVNITNNTSNIENGTVIGIEVVSKNLLKKKVYTITVHKEKASMLSGTTIIVIVVIIVLAFGIAMFVRSSKTKFEPANLKKVDNSPLAHVPEVGQADMNGLQQVKKDEATNVNVISVNEANVAQVMQDTQVHNVQRNTISSNVNSVVMTQKTAAMPKVVADNQNIINENDYTGDIYEERDANGNFLRYVDGEGNTIEYVDEQGNQIKMD